VIVTKLAVLLISAFCTGHGINQGGYDSIRSGMTRSEVTSTLIAFPGDYRLIPDVRDPMIELAICIHMLGKGFGGNSSGFWASDFGEIYVNFDDHDRATSKAYIKSTIRANR
jgi:hypothetical protein